MHMSYGSRCVNLAQAGFTQLSDPVQYKCITTEFKQKRGIIFPLRTDWQTRSPSRHGPSSSRQLAPLQVPPKLLVHNNAEAERLAAVAVAEKEKGEIGVDGRSSPTCKERTAEEGGGTLAVGMTPPPPVGGSSRGPAAGGRWCTRSRRWADADASRVPATGGTDEAAAGAWLGEGAAWVRR